LALTGILLLAGCASFGKTPLLPEVHIPENWNSAPEGQTAIQPPSEWWKTLNDPELTGLIEKASGQSLDVREALSKIREARYRLLQSRSSLFPAVDATAAMKKSGGGQSRSQTRTLAVETDEMYSAGFDAAWEVDIFGRVRHSVNALEADLGAWRENYNSIMTTLLSEVAVNYLELRTLQARIWVIQNRVTAQEQTLALTTALLEAGREGELAVYQARAGLETSRSGLPDLKARIQAAMNRLAVLTGQTPGTLQAELSEPKPLPDFPDRLAIGIPAETLRRRPDVRKAEKELAARVARTAQARAELYPKLTLTGSIGFEAFSLSKLFTSANRIWSLGPSITWPLFDAGAVRYNVKAETEVQKQALIGYEAAILTALEEVENALATLASARQKMAILESGMDASKMAADLARSQYTAGLIGFSEVLDAEQSLLSMEEQLAQAQGSALTGLVQLYKALGGGWECFNPQTAGAPS
jgi:NodT family efflux transporter outer membrane factor (OMF) lipoprotein